MAIGYLDDSKLTAIADAIRTKAEISGTMTVDQMPANILAIDDRLEEKDVNFYDWDGTLLYSYTLAEVQALSALPPIPGNYKDYDALWWSEELSFIKNLTQPWMVGMVYATDREGAYIYITVPEPDTSLGEDTSIYFRPEASMSVDWGDGTSETVAAQTQVRHLYSQSGDYRLYLQETGSWATNLTAPNEYTPMLMSSQAYVRDYSGRTQMISDRLVTAVETGASTCIRGYAFAGQTALEKVLLCRNMLFNSSPQSAIAFKGCPIKFLSIPDSFIGWQPGLTSYLPNVERIVWPSVQFRYPDYSYDYNLKKINWPAINRSGVTSTGVFRCCLTLDRTIEIPEGVTSIPAYAFAMTDGIMQGPTVGPKIGAFPSTLTTIGANAFWYYKGPTNSFTIPASVTSIGDYCFYEMDSGYINTVIFESSTPPTIQSRTFGPPSMTHIKIYVPYGAKSTYTASSSYWMDYANLIYELPQA